MTEYYRTYGHTRGTAPNNGPCTVQTLYSSTDGGNASAQGFSSNGNNGACGSNGLAVTVVQWMLELTPAPATHWRCNSSCSRETSSICTADIRWLRLDASTGTPGTDSGATYCCVHASVCVSALSLQLSATQRLGEANSHGSDVAGGDGSA